MAQPSRAFSGMRGAEDYPFDPAARVDELRGLDRLRAVADRRHAAHLFVLYVQADRNSDQLAQQSTRAVTLAALKRVGARSLAGELGLDARELAEYLLLDERGQQRDDDASWRAFGVGFRKLRQGP